jgi:class 3 adenylate cyclase
VNLASRIAGAAGPGEVLVSEAVVDAVDNPAWQFERADAAVLKGITDPVLQFRVRISGRTSLTQGTDGAPGRTGGT